jgi:hypothetical protein
MSSAEGQYVKSVRADVLFSLYSIRKSGILLYVLHQTRFFFLMTTFILEDIHLNIDFRLCLCVTCLLGCGRWLVKCSWGLVILSKDMPRLFESDK